MKNPILATAIATALLGVVALPAQRAFADAESDKLRERIEKLEEAQEKQADQAAQTRTAIKAAEWASKLKFAGDFRYRNEQIQRDARTDQMRDRVRARLSLSAKATDTINVSARLATGADDPRSSNQSLGAGGSGWARRQIGLDQYFVSWKPGNGAFTFTGGKMATPFWRPGQSLFVDGDLNPEGLAMNYQQGMFFANAYGLWLSERGAVNADPVTGNPTAAINPQQSGSNYVGAQFGVKLPVGSSNFTGAVSYSDLGAGQGRQPFWFATTTTTAAAAANGNTVSGANLLQYDFTVMQVSLEFNTKVGTLPLQLFADFAKNDNADNGLDQAHTAGVLLGKAGEARTWEVGVAYQEMEKDAYFAQFIDSDFANGVTDGKGSVVRFAYAPLKNWTLNATYFINTLNLDGTVSATAPREEDYKRLQLDFNVKF